MRSRGRWVHPGSLDSLGFALAIRIHWVHSGWRWDTLGSSGVVGFTQARPGVRWVVPGSLNSLGFALGSSGVVGLIPLAVEVVGYIRGRCVRSGSPFGSLGSLGVVWCTWVCPGNGNVQQESFG